MNTKTSDDYIIPERSEVVIYEDVSLNESPRRLGWLSIELTDEIRKEILDLAEWIKETDNQPILDNRRFHLERLNMENLIEYGMAADDFTERLNPYDRDYVLKIKDIKNNIVYKIIHEKGILDILIDGSDNVLLSIHIEMLNIFVSEINRLAKNNGV
jgi:hypothetical protein